MSEIIDRFEREYLTYNRISSARRIRQLKLLAQLESEVGDLTTLKPSHLQEMAGGLLDQGRHVNTVTNHLNMVRSFVSWMYAAELISADQYLRLKTVKNPRGATTQTVPRPYTQAEIARFWEVLAEVHPLLPETGRNSKSFALWAMGKRRWSYPLHHHAQRLQIDAIVHLALDCGMRRGEILRLKMEDLHPENEYIAVQGAAKGSRGMSKERAVPFTIEARQSVHTWMVFRSYMKPPHDSPWVMTWKHNYNLPYGEWHFSKVPNRRTGFELHRFRHTCATNWLRAGVELETVSRLLGHATLQQTLAYAQILKADISKSMGDHEAEFRRLTGSSPMRRAA